VALAGTTGKPERRVRAMGLPGSGGALSVRSTIVCATWRSLALSAAVGGPEPPRSFTRLSRLERTRLLLSTMSWPVSEFFAVKPPSARTRAAVSAAA
jgi:hypothetical protein